MDKTGSERPGTRSAPSGAARIGGSGGEVMLVYGLRELAKSIGDGCWETGNPVPDWDKSADGRFATAGGRLARAFVRDHKP